jgi:muramoyltetrapeptide carboxypeptidase
MPLLTGKPLPPGGTIGIVTPASPYNTRSDVLRGIAWWEARGYHVTLAAGALDRTDYFAGSPARRAADLVDMFADPAVDAIQCLRGGFGSAEIIPLLDFASIAAHPKAFVGFSDITALHCALQRFTGLATFYGPSLTSLHDPDEAGLTGRRLLQVLSGATTGALPRNPADPFQRTLSPGRASGRLVGGCLSDLMHTLGTPWEFDLQGAIFVFEEVGSSPHSIERALLQLSQAGKLNGLRGIAIGELPGCEWNGDGGSPFPHTKTLEQVFEDRLAGLGVPVVTGFPFGHGDPFVTLPLGVQATLDGTAGTLSVDEAALAA